MNNIKFINESLFGSRTTHDLTSQAFEIKKNNFGNNITYSPKVFIPLTTLCQDSCAYCTFVKSPNEGGTYLNMQEVESIALVGEASGCFEALFTLGDKPELKWKFALQELNNFGYSSTHEYLTANMKNIHENYNIFPHANPGLMTSDEISEYRKYSPSGGLMLESFSPQLLEQGRAHYKAKTKRIELRIETLNQAEIFRYPMTTGLLIGITETKEELINDIIPSEKFGEKINSSDWIDLMKGIKIYNIKTEILEFESYDPFSIDSGIVVAKVNKKVLSAMWSDKSRPEFNIVITEKNNEISQKVRYTSEEVFRFKFTYKLNTNYSESKIISINKINELNKRFIYIPYKQSLPPLVGKKVIMKNLTFKDETLSAKGDNINYFIENENIDLKKYKIEALAAPKVTKSEGYMKTLLYREKMPTSLQASILLIQDDILDFGAGIQPTQVEYSETYNFSGAADLYHVSSKMDVGLKYQSVESNTHIQLNEFEKANVLGNPITNFENTYVRTNSITNFDETLALSQQMLFITVKYEVLKGTWVFVNVNAWGNNVLTSTRSASAKYTGTFSDAFNVEIDEPIEYEIQGNSNTLELGYKEWDVVEDINLEVTPGSVYEAGILYKLPFNLAKGVNLSVFGLYKGNTASWFENSAEEISKDFTELNSFVNIADKVQMKQRISGGISIDFKL